MILPKLLGRVLAGHALQDLGAARVLVDEFGHVVDGGVDDAVQDGLVGSLLCGVDGLGIGRREERDVHVHAIVRAVFLGDVVFCECFGHFGFVFYEEVEGSVRGEEEEEAVRVGCIEGGVVRLDIGCVYVGVEREGLVRDLLEKLLSLLCSLRRGGGCACAGG